ncbi:hypothetical protein DSM104443_02151 [Usitatibacter rugosus]|uniref:Uncharacterized protein n=1 Tax=Usitatibacter rugosus TaxID=2732067 RepID=A0A6M4GUT5_9PROT|nr:hypothetical protein [Usitatibacter rugosus]QJR11080.1 hypothetical protein DSM104443_02151 [Usitatibacter rugosus]
MSVTGPVPHEILSKRPLVPAASPSPRDFRGFVEVRRAWLSETAVAYEVSQALEECYAVSLALAPADPFVAVAAQRSWAAMAAGESLAAPCRGFEAQRIDPNEVLALLRHAADGGEARARARMLLMRDVTAPKEEALAEIPALLAHLDPGVVRDVGAFLVRGETEVVLGETRVPARVAVIAWELAACDLGYACGADSRLTLGQCAFGGTCGAGSYEDALSRSEPREDFDAAREIRSGIVRALRTSDWRWLGIAA